MKWLLAIPHQIVVFALWIVSGTLVMVAFFVVIITGPPWPVCGTTRSVAPKGDQPIVSYCGSGITATHFDFVLAGMGRDQTRLYDASLSEWAPEPSLPMKHD